MPKSKHLYRVNVYLGKDNYNQIQTLADYMKVSVAQMTRIILDTGLQIARTFENGGSNNGRK